MNKLDKFYLKYLYGINRKREFTPIQNHINNVFCANFKSIKGCHSMYSDLDGDIHLKKNIGFSDRFENVEEFVEYYINNSVVPLEERLRINQILLKICIEFNLPRLIDKIIF